MAHTRPGWFDQVVEHPAGGTGDGLGLAQRDNASAHGATLPQPLPLSGRSHLAPGVNGTDGEPAGDGQAHLDHGEAGPLPQ